MYNKHITPCPVVITSLLVHGKPLEASASVKRVYCYICLTLDRAIMGNALYFLTEQTVFNNIHVPAHTTGGLLHVAFRKVILHFPYYIAQIRPLSFQTSIPHTPRQVRWGELHASVVTEWSPVLVTPKRTSHRQLKTSNGRSSQLNKYCSYKPHSNFKPTLIFWKILYECFK